ncbi:MAG: hypothetical protein Q8O88_05270 [bacterium]|nr:hypothetical protein [bacterium]
MSEKRFPEKCYYISMLAKVNSYAIVGHEAVPVGVRADKICHIFI